MGGFDVSSTSTGGLSRLSRSQSTSSLKTLASSMASSKTATAAPLPKGGKTSTPQLTPNLKALDLAITQVPSKDMSSRHSKMISFGLEALDLGVSFLES